MGLVVTRCVKTGGVVTEADGIGAYVNPSRVGNARKSSNITVPSPESPHISVPIGPEAKNITVEFSWSMVACPATGKTYEQSLKQWTCNSLYKLTPTGSLVAELTSGDTYWLAKNIIHERSAPGTKECYPRWKVTLNLVKVRAVDVTDCPDFTDTNLSNPDLSGVTTPSLTLTAATPGALGDSITVKLTKIRVVHSGTPQSFALYNEEALTILPPLGNLGPVIEIEFMARTNTVYNVVAQWEANSSTVVAATHHMYPEFDVDNPPTYYSRWMVDDINVNRVSADAGGYKSGGIVERKVSMRLTRYYLYELMELS